jgi:hypothetical protein
MHPTGRAIARENPSMSASASSPVTRPRCRSSRPTVKWPHPASITRILQRSRPSRLSVAHDSQARRLEPTEVGRIARGQCGTGADGSRHDHTIHQGAPPAPRQVEQPRVIAEKRERLTERLFRRRQPFPPAPRRAPRSRPRRPKSSASGRASEERGPSTALRRAASRRELGPRGEDAGHGKSQNEAGRQTTARGPDPSDTACCASERTRLVTIGTVERRYRSEQERSRSPSRKSFSEPGRLESSTNMQSRAEAQSRNLLPSMAAETWPCLAVNRGLRRYPIYRDERLNRRRKSSAAAFQNSTRSTRRWPSPPNAGNRWNVATRRSHRLEYAAGEILRECAPPQRALLPPTLGPL